ncbi:MAG: hypothetical protein PHY40_02455 [Patescibacteria group bacterium]|nr:hypothetical protein [Patescibacteria group bacterium]
MFDNIYTNFVFILTAVSIISYIIFKAVSYIAAWRIKKFTEKIIKEEEKNASK